tara:strand:+ start:119 stop:484 length:366 start_codon:yes stop_codon:yes gene_type:complete
MSINQTEYKELKEYWDFQRKIEYNREKVQLMVQKTVGRVYNEFGMMSEQELFDGIWSKLPQDAYEEPTKDWIPQNEKYRLWYEPAPGPAQIEYKKKTGRPVVLRSKHLQNLAGFDDDEKLY